MKFITSNEPINFKVTSSRIYDITPTGVTVSDTDAAVISERLGYAVTVTDMDEPTVVAEVVAPEAVAEPAASVTPEPMPEETVVPAPEAAV